MNLLLSQILMACAALFGIFQLFRMNDPLAKAITFFQVVAIATSLFPFPFAKTIGFYLFWFMMLVALIYLLARKIDPTAKRLMAIIIIPVFLRLTFQLFNWPYASELSLAMSVPLVAYFVLITRKVSIKNEISFLTLIAVEALLGFSVIISRWLQLN